MDIEFTTKSVETKYIKINGEEFRMSLAFDFINLVLDTDGFLTGVKCTGTERDFAEALEEEGLVGHSHSAGFFSKDEDGLRELRGQLYDQYE